MLLYFSFICVWFVQISTIPYVLYTHKPYMIKPIEYLWIVNTLIINHFQYTTVSYCGLCKSGNIYSPENNICRKGSFNFITIVSAWLQFPSTVAWASLLLGCLEYWPGWSVVVLPQYRCPSIPWIINKLRSAKTDPYIMDKWW